MVQQVEAGVTSFSNPNMDAHLKKHGASRLYVSGVYSEGCIRATAIGARKKGYHVVLVAHEVREKPVKY
jgi:nicotinamidase-related amidase